MSSSLPINSSIIFLSANALGTNSALGNAPARFIFPHFIQMLCQREPVFTKIDVKTNLNAGMDCISFHKAENIIKFLLVYNKETSVYPILISSPVLTPEGISAIGKKESGLKELMS